MAKNNLTLWIVLGVVAVLIIGGAVFYFFKGSGSAGTNNIIGNNNAPIDGVSGSALVKDSEGRIIVEMKDIKFVPAQVEIFVGQTIKWLNKDSTQHQIYSFSNDNDSSLP